MLYTHDLNIISIFFDVKNHTLNKLNFYINKKKKKLYIILHKYYIYRIIFYNVITGFFFVF